MSSQLARNAKDWALLIRASQIIPVYPLTEDIQPGDVFIVRTSIEEQIKVYESSGFLPMDNLLVRLPLTTYSQFYAGLYNTETNAQPPGIWQTFDGSTNNWASAPRAAFPSYAFTIKKGIGLNLAVPIQGVPIALSIMGSSYAHGEVAISDSYTYGMDIYSAQAVVIDWASKNIAYLANYSPSATGTNYLRVVNRVYLAGSVNISIFNDSSGGIGISGGDAKPLDVLNPSTNTDSNYTGLLATLDRIFNNALPGGTIKVAGASSRSLSMIETFPRPLVIGYIGFDLPILEHGMVGRPIATQLRLSRVPIAAGKTTTFGEDRNTESIRRWLEESSTNPLILREWLSQYRHTDVSLTEVLSSKENAALRQEIIVYFNLGESHAQPNSRP